MEVKVEEEKKRAEKKDDEKDKLNNEGEGASIAPASLDIRMLVNFVDQLENRNNATFKNYLITLHGSVERMYKEMGTVSTLKCMADRSLSTKPKEDAAAPRIDLEAYYTFASCVKMLHRGFYNKVLGKEKTDRAIYEHYAGIMYRLIFQKAYQATNIAFDRYFRSFFKIIFCCRWRKKTYIKNLWDRIEVYPLAPFSQFDLSHKIWRNYQLNERGDRGLFRSMDRIKLLHNMLLDSINIYELEAVGLITGITPLHDQFALDGKSKEPLFDEFPGIKNFHEPLDVTEKKAKILGLLQGMSDTASPSDFIDQPLTEKLAFNCYDMAEINIESIQNYFGEKVALYFEFLMYHTRRLYYISLFGIVIFVVDQLMTRLIGFEPDHTKLFDANSITKHDIALIVFKMNRLALAVATVIWSSIYLEYWKRKQQYFAIKYGMTDFEDTENKRPSFQGEYMRDLASSAFNFMHYPSIRRLGTSILTYLVIIIVVVVSIVISGACLLIRRTFRNDEKNDPIVIYFVPALINYLCVKAIEFLYYKVAVFFNRKENHETLTRFEDSLINKIFVFNFFNAFNSFFIIGFIKYIQSESGNNLLFGKCINSSVAFRIHLSCFEELSGQTFSFFVLAFVFNFLEILGPMVWSCFQSKFLGIPRRYAWGKVDYIIDDEFQREDKLAATEVDGVLRDYSEVTIQFASLSFFGMVFPLAFLLSYFTSIFEIHIDKLYYMHYVRRPIPRSAADIGSWQYILEAISFFTIFVNAGLVVFTSEAFNEVNFIIFAGDRTRFVDEFSMKMKYYVFVVFVLLFIKLVLGVVIKDTPDNIKLILARHQNIIAKTIKKPRESNANGKSGFPIHPLPNQIGLITDMKKNVTAKTNEENPEENKSKSATPFNEDPDRPAFSLKQELNIEPGENPFSVD